MIDLTIIGCGNMGRAFAEGMLRGGVVSPESLRIVERREERRISLKSDLGCECFETIGDLANSGYVMLAMKPQDLAGAAAALAPLLKENQVVISLLAGVSLEVLQRALGGHQKMVRSMPNLPAVIGAGMTGYICAPSISETERGEVSRIFDAAGESLELDSEGLLNAFTAVAGSGPGYLYYIIEAWKDAALGLGFSSEQANILITQTLTGSLWLWSDSGNDEKELRKRVTSKGGTTEAAVSVLDQGQVAEIFQRALKRCAERSGELEQMVKERL